MPLTTESWWRAEFVPLHLLQLGAALQDYYKLDVSKIGYKGATDSGHLRGYHRSRNWIENSTYCTDDHYSVTETPGNRNGGDGNWICALDLQLPREQLLAACQRLDEAVRAGRLEKVTEWYGNSDGDGRVDGYNNILNRVATSDSSHLWHLHMSFDRGRANDDHTDVFRILTGETMAMTAQDVVALWQLYLAPGGYNMQDHLLTAEAAARESVELLKAIAKKVDIDQTELDQIKASAKAGAASAAPEIAREVLAQLNPEAIVALLNDAVSAETAEAVAALFAARLAPPAVKA